MTIFRKCLKISWYLLRRLLVTCFWFFGFTFSQIIPVVFVFWYHFTPKAISEVNKEHIRDSLRLPRILMHLIQTSEAIEPQPVTRNPTWFTMLLVNILYNLASDGVQKLCSCIRQAWNIPKQKRKKIIFCHTKAGPRSSENSSFPLQVMYGTP